ncbi:uncharacterized protein si:dkey-251i10.2 isoform X1 [Onychostoma macrolepis]|uniref:uncharacterized protein si:dkey-251i10.2 isoform X1 n=1 Tax=Onychostoma macrolepis TaxID=369639 RepID=UPI00272C5DC8|nr:uncharacterized protein si:dkey-251i10.2 isoform X1 [Onychostoma macrolepis]
MDRAPPSDTADPALRFCSLVPLTVIVGNHSGLIQSCERERKEEHKATKATHVLPTTVTLRIMNTSKKHIHSNWFKVIAKINDRFLKLKTCFLWKAIPPDTMHGGVQPKPNPAPYTIHPSSTTFQTGKPITVVIKGPDYRGVLLEARSGSDSKAIGTWQTPPTNTKFLECSGNQQGAITHANTNIKNNSTVYTWIPPATAQNVFFKATVAQQRIVFWVDVISSTLTSSGGTLLDVVHDSAERIVTPALLLLVVLLAIVQNLVA